MRVHVMCLIATIPYSLLAASEGNTATSLHQPEKAGDHKPATAVVSTPLGDPNLERQVSVDEKGVKTLKLIGNDPNFEAEHARWKQQHDAYARARIAAAAAEQRRQVEAQASEARVQPPKSEHSEKKADMPKQRKQAEPKRTSQKNKRPVYMLWGGGTVP